MCNPCKCLTRQLGKYVPVIFIFFNDYSLYNPWYAGSGRHYKQLCNFRSYTYFTDLPDKYYVTESGLRLTRSAPSQTTSDNHKPISAPAVTSDVPMALMKLEGAKPIPQHIKERMKKSKVVYRNITKETNNQKVATPLAADDLDSVIKGSCNESLAGGSGEEKPTKKIHLKGKGRRLKKTFSSTFPKGTVQTISMKMSSIDKGEAYAYGSGIVEEHTSFLEITSQS